MEGSVLTSICFFISLALVNCQYAVPFDGSTDIGLEKFVDPYTLQALKLKYPKKFLPKLPCARDLAYEARCKLAGKLLARHLKYLNGNYNLQNQMYGCGQNQPLMVQPIMLPGQPTILPQQPQPQLSVFQYQFDPMKASAFAPSVDPQAALSQLSELRYQQPSIMPQGSLGLSSIHPQQTVLHTPVPVHLQRNE